MTGDDKSTRDQAPQPSEPVSMVDGIPDRSSTAPRWVVPLLVVVFLAWVGFLVWIKVTGSPTS